MPLVHALPPSNGGPPFQIKVPTATIIGTTPSLHALASIFGGLILLIPPATYTYFNSSGSTVGANIIGSVGVGVSYISTGWQVSGVGVGVGWKIDMQTINGKLVQVLTVVWNNADLMTQSSAILTPEKIGLSAETVAQALLNGSLDSGLGHAMLFGSGLVNGTNGGWYMEFNSYWITYGEIIFY